MKNTRDSISFCHFFKKLYYKINIYIYNYNISDLITVRNCFIKHQVKTELDDRPVAKLLNFSLTHRLPLKCEYHNSIRFINTALISTEKSYSKTSMKMLQAPSL